MDERLGRFFEHYVTNNVFNAETLKEDPDKIFKLRVLEKLYGTAISDDLKLLHYINKLHGPVELYQLLTSSVVSRSDIEDTAAVTLSASNLVSQEKAGTFGYDLLREQFRYCTYIIKNNKPQLVYIYTDLSSLIVLDNLRVESVVDHQELGSLNNFVEYADYEVCFVKYYLEWSDKFNSCFDAWLATL